MSGELAAMTVKFGGDLDDLRSATKEGKALVEDFAQSVRAATYDLKQMGAVDLSDVSSGLRKVVRSLSDVGSSSKKATADVAEVGEKGKKAGADVSAGASKAKAATAEMGAKGKKAGSDVAEGATKAKTATKELAEASEQTGTTFSAEAKKMASSLSGIGSKAVSAGGSFLGSIGKMIGGLVNFGAKIGMTVIGLQGLAQGAESLGETLFGANASMEQTQVAFVGLLHGSAAANKELKSLQQLAAETPFEFPDLARSEQKLIAFQIPLAKTHPLLIAIGDALSGLGENTPATLDQVVSVFGQMQAAGKITTEDLLQLTDVGINGFQLLADQMHKPVSVIKQMVTDGVIPASDGIEMLRKGMEQTFGGGMQAQSKTFLGLLSTVKDNVGMAWRSFTGPLFDMAKQNLTKIGDLVSSPKFQKFASGAGKLVGDALAKIGKFAAPLVHTFESLVTHLDLSKALPPLQHLADLAGGLLSQKLDFLGKMVTQVGSWFESKMLPVLEDVAPKFFDLGQLVENLAETALPPLIDSAEELLPPLVDLAGTLADSLKPVLKNLQPMLKDLGGVLTTVVVPALSAMIEGTSKAVHWLEVMSDRMNGVTESANKMGEQTKKSMNDLASDVDAKKRIQTLDKERQEILKELSETTDESKRKRLQMQLDAIDLAEKQAKASIAASDFEKQQRLKKLDELKTQSEEKQKNIYTDTLSAIGQWKDDMLAKVGTLASGIPLVLGQLKDRAVNKFNELKDQSQAKVRELVSNVQGFFASLPAKAFQWGENLIQGFINGIKAKISGVEQATEGVAGAVHEYMGHSSPTKKGPGRTSDKWGPNLVSMFADGIRAGQPEVESALQSLYRVPSAGPAFGAGVQTAQSIASQMSGGGRQAPQEIHVHVYLDSREIAHYSADATANLVVKKVLSQGKVKKVA